MLIVFKTSKASEYIQKGGYQATLLGTGSEELLSLATLDGSNEELMDVLLNAIMDLKAEGKTVTDIRYKGKSVQRWFRIVYPDALSPYFLGIFTSAGVMVGYLVVFQSPLSVTRKLIGIALIQGARGKHVASRVIKHIQEHLASIFQSPVTELNFETSRTNVAMMRVASQLGFVEYRIPGDKSWKDTGIDRIRFIWRKS